MGDGGAFVLHQLGEARRTIKELEVELERQRSRANVLESNIHGMAADLSWERRRFDDLIRALEAIAQELDREDYMWDAGDRLLDLIREHKGVVS